MHSTEPGRPSEPGGEQGTAPPSWYADPSGQWAWRWWDGRRWTEQVSPGTARPTPTYSGAPSYGPRPAYAYPSVPSAYDRFADQHGSMPWARRAFVAYAVVAVVGLLISWASYSSIHQALHLLHGELATGVAQPQPVRSPALTVLSLLGTLVDIGVYLTVLIWQYRAAKTAQALGIPAHLSPGLGVGGWFIPVVNLWFPYRAMSDCLPPGDPGRRIVLRMWLLLLAAWMAQLATFILVLTYGPAAFVTGAVVAGAVAGFAYFATRTVTVVADMHRGLLYPSSAEVATTMPG